MQAILVIRWPAWAGYAVEGVDLFRLLPGAEHGGNLTQHRNHQIPGRHQPPFTRAVGVLLPWCVTGQAGGFGPVHVSLRQGMRYAPLLSQDATQVGHKLLHSAARVHLSYNICAARPST